MFAFHVQFSVVGIECRRVLFSKGSVMCVCEVTGAVVEVISAKPA